MVWNEIRNVRVTVLLGILLCLPMQASGQEKGEPTDLLMALIRLRTPGIQNIAARPEVARAVSEQNEKKMSMDEIMKIDAQWQTTTALTPRKKSLQQNQAGRILKSFVERATQTYTEAFVTDAQGANVAAYPATSDYWQGDEKEFQVPFETGEIYFGPVRFDESSQAYAVKVGVPVFGEDNSRIGVLIMGVRLSK